jgi:hypothetical protein
MYLKQQNLPLITWNAASALVTDSMYWNTHYVLPFLILFYLILSKETDNCMKLEWR